MNRTLKDLTYLTHLKNKVFKLDGLNFGEFMTFLSQMEEQCNEVTTWIVIPQMMQVEHNYALSPSLRKSCDIAMSQIPALPKSYFHKNGRQPKNKGQMHLGWTSFAGPQTTAICGIQMPYLTNSYKKMVKRHPLLLKSIMGIVDHMWTRALDTFPEETKEMLKVSSQFLLGNTGFNKISCATNLNALWHTCCCWCSDQASY